jgi:hypothetical protein
MSRAKEKFVMRLAFGRTQKFADRRQILVSLKAYRIEFIDP